MTTVYTAARLITAAADGWIADGAVAVDGDRITYAGPAAAAPDGVHVALGDVTLMPGLIDMHVHLTFSASGDVLGDYLHDSDAVRLLRGADAARRAVLAGITTVRECGGRNAQVFALRDAVRDGVLPGPRIIAAGASITTTGGHCWFFGLEADSADDLRRAVRAQVKAGADFIKVMATGGALTPSTNPVAPQYDEAQLQALVDDARRLGRRVSAHCHGTTGVLYAARAGVTTIEHCSFQTPTGLEYDDAAAAAVQAAGCYVCPTLAIGERMTPAQRSVFEAMKVHVEHDKFVLVHAGFHPSVPLEKQIANADMLRYPTDRDEAFHPLWMRFKPGTDAAPKGRVLIHGHTSVRRAFVGKKRINIDTGAKYGGPITALEIVDDRLRLHQAWPAETDPARWNKDGMR